jgi:spore germination protein YaaH
MDLEEYFGQPEDGEAVLILGTEKLEERALVNGEEIYLPLEVVNTYLNQRFYWDQEGSQVLYATPSELTEAPAQSEFGGDVYLRDGSVYLNISYVQRYTDLDLYVGENPSRVAIQYSFSDRDTVTATAATKIRYRGGIKSEILTDVYAGETLYLLEELEDWDQVATADGFVGYVEKKKVGTPEVTSVERDFQTEAYTYYTMDDYVNLVWHQVTTFEANDYLSEAVQNVSGVNVISPTWFTMTDNNGNIASIASTAYVQQAHELGMQVWGLIDNFSENMSTTEVLSKTSSRQNLIRNMISAALEVGMDGINVDFEALSEDVGIHFLEFLRELSIECHKNNLVLSVDNPVPEDFTSHYDRAEQGRVVDYVIVMGYDEHYGGSDVAGSVASLPWVEKGIQDTLADVPAERVINAIPFYTRLWKVENGVLSSEAIGMDVASQTMDTYQVETYWDTSTGQNYGSYESEGASYQIWLEDAQSIATKVQLVPKYHLAGVAAWKLGFENSGIWQTITDNLNTTVEE